MSYALQRDETVQAGTRRLIRELIDECLEEAQSDRDVDERIHEIRKALKRVRAALRLVRTATTRYARENARYRDTGRLLSDLRDTRARLETLDELEERLLDATDATTIAALRADLEARHQRAFDGVDAGALMARVTDELCSGVDALGEVEVATDGFPAVRGGLAKTYRRGRRLFAEAHVDSSVEVFHTWRKRVKYHRYHVDLLTALWPPLFEGWEDALHDLTDDLGLAHDVAVLDKVLVESPEILNDSVATQRIRAALQEASAGWRRDALSRGRRAFAETPEAMVDRVHVYWDAWTHH